MTALTAREQTILAQTGAGITLDALGPARSYEWIKKAAAGGTIRGAGPDEGRHGIYRATKRGIEVTWDGPDPERVTIAWRAIRAHRDQLPAAVRDTLDRLEREGTQNAVAMFELTDRRTGKCRDEAERERLTDLAVDILCARQDLMPSLLPFAYGADRQPEQLALWDAS